MGKRLLLSGATIALLGACMCCWFHEAPANMLSDVLTYRVGTKPLPKSLNDGTWFSVSAVVFAIGLATCILTLLSKRKISTKEHGIVLLWIAGLLIGGSSILAAVATVDLRQCLYKLATQPTAPTTIDTTTMSSDAAGKLLKATVGWAIGGGAVLLAGLTGVGKSGPRDAAAIPNRKIYVGMLAFALFLLILAAVARHAGTTEVASLFSGTSVIRPSDLALNIQSLLTNTMLMFGSIACLGGFLIGCCVLRGGEK